MTEPLLHLIDAIDASRENPEAEENTAYLRSMAYPHMARALRLAMDWLKEEKAFQELQPDDWCTSRACWPAQEDFRRAVEGEEI